MEERKITEAESIEIITAMISKTKERLVKGAGDILLMWGYLVVVSTALIWVLLFVTRNQAVNWLWFVMAAIGGIATPIMAKKQQGGWVKSYSDKLGSQIWAVVGICALVMSVSCLAFSIIGGKDSWGAMFAFGLLICPFAEIAQGLIIREKCLVAGGCVGLAAGIFLVCCVAGGVKLMASWVLPLFMVAYAAMMIVPGHILNHKAKGK